jgi:hypothetical protein
MIGLAMLLAAESATFLGGAELYGLCTGSKEERLECVRYVEGVADGVAFTQSAEARNVREVCIPPETTLKKLTTITVKYMKKHPAERESRAGILTWSAFKATYPCPK